MIILKGWGNNMKTWNSYKNDVKKLNDGTFDDKAEMEEMAKVVQKIVSKREKLGLSQRELAEMCNMPQSTVARIETYKTSPTLETLVKITRELGLRVAVV